MLWQKEPLRGNKIMPQRKGSPVRQAARRATKRARSK
jgi:hypothetical protein